MIQLSYWKEREPSGNVTSIAGERDGLLLKPTLHLPRRQLYVCGPRTHSTQRLSEVKQVSKVGPARKKQEVHLKKERKKTVSSVSYDHPEQAETAWIRKEVSSPLAEQTVC